MTSLVSPADVKALMNTSIPDGGLQSIIDRVEAQITERIGAPWAADNTPTQMVATLRGNGENLYLPVEIYDVVSIVEDNIALTTLDYRVWGGGVIERGPFNVGPFDWSGAYQGGSYLGEGPHWGGQCVVTYHTADDRLKRKQVIIDLVRLVINHVAFRQETVAGEYSYYAYDNWDREFSRTMKRLMFKAL